MYTLAWSFRNRIDVLIQSIKSADETCPKEVDFCLVDGASNDDTIKKLREFCNTIEGRSVRICESAYRTTCQEAWNLGVMLSKTRYVILTSSDCTFLKTGWFEAIKAKMETGIEYLIMTNHSVFCIDKRLVARIGFFDECFKHGPHVDVDYMIRSTEAGVQVMGLENTGYYDHGHGEGEDYADRCKQEIPDRLAMHTFENDEVFMNKWQSGWPGWRGAAQAGHSDLPHPPTGIHEVTRVRPEVDTHPLYRQRCAEF